MALNRLIVLVRFFSSSSEEYIPGDVERPRELASVVWGDSAKLQTLVAVGVGEGEQAIGFGAMVDGDGVLEAGRLQAVGVTVGSCLALGFAVVTDGRAFGASVACRSFSFLDSSRSGAFPFSFSTFFC